MSTLNPNIPSPELSRLLSKAATYMQDYGLKWLTPQLLLRAMLDDKKCAAHQILRSLQAKRGFDWTDLDRRVETMAKHSLGRDAKFNFTDDFGKHIPLAEEMLVVIDEGLSIAQSREEMKAGSGHALAAMADRRVTTSGALSRMGITQAAILGLLDEVTAEGVSVIRDYIDEAKKGDAQAYFQRPALLRKMMSLLSLAQSRHMVLVGQPGSGRRTLVYSLAQLLAEGKGLGDFRSVVEINETALLDNPLSAMRVGLRRASGGILLMPDIGRFFGGRLRTPFPQQVNHELHKAMLGNEVTVIGTVVSAEYDLLTQHRPIREHSHRLDVPATDGDETLSILSYHRVRLEDEYELEVTRDALNSAATLAGQYIKNNVLPGAAVQLADRAAALVRMVMGGYASDMPQVAPDSRLDADDVRLALSLITGIPVTKLGEDEQAKYANMASALHKRIIGQEEAVLAVSRAVKTARVGLREPKRPIGSFLFLGPSGVGKSELAKALAEFMFGEEDAMLVLDMSEYQEESAVNRLIGAPPGYVGFEGGGQLTDFVRQKPYTVVLFDEIEKAHPRVLDVLLQVMDEGRLTDGQGRLTTFSETVVIMTSNLGAYHMLVPTIGERERELVLAEVKKFLRPEFINRLDDVILFHQLTPEQLRLILGLMLKKEHKLAGKRGLTLNITDSAKDWMLAQNDQPEYGARPLRRIIGRYLREPLADFLLSGKVSAVPTTITIDQDGEKLTFESQRTSDL